MAGGEEGEPVERGREGQRAGAVCPGGKAGRGTSWGGIVPAAGQDAAASGGRDAAVKPPPGTHAQSPLCLRAHPILCTAAPLQHHRLQSCA